MSVRMRPLWILVNIVLRHYANQFKFPGLEYYRVLQSVLEYMKARQDHS